MAETTDIQAYEALAKHPRLPDLVALTQLVASQAAEARGPEWRAAEKVKKLAEEQKLGQEDAKTDLGDALEVLQNGPRSRAEATLARALWAHAVAESRPKTVEDEDRLATAALWLAAHTPFDATGLLDRALGDDAADLWAAIADRVRRIHQDPASDARRGEALVGAAALAQSTSSAATKHAKALATELKDAALVRLLQREPILAPDAELEGEITAAPRGLVVTTILALTGILFLLHVGRLAGRAALAYKRPAKVRVSEAGLRIAWHTEILGRTLEKNDVLLPREGITSVVREVRYPRAAFYAGLGCLAVGSFVGVRALADGVRAASPSLVLVGLAFVAVGVLLELFLGSLVPGAKGECRVIIRPTTGPRIAVAGIPLARADAALPRLLVPPPS